MDEENKVDILDLNAPEENAEEIKLQSEEVKEEVKLDSDAKPEEEVKEPEPQEEMPEEFQQYGELGKFAMELKESGDISDNSIAEIKEKYGLPEVIIREYIDTNKELLGAKASKAEQDSKAFLGDMHDSVGGESRYAEITQWARATLSEAEIGTFNKMVEGSQDSAKFAVAGLKARFESIHGEKPALVQGKAVSARSDGYNSMSDYVADLADPRAKFDKHYRAKIEEKLNRSDLSKLK